MKRVLEVVGGLTLIIGFGGVAGAVEQGTNLAVPLLMVVCGALLMGFTSIAEVVKIEKSNSDIGFHTGIDASRPSYLR